MTTPTDALERQDGPHIYEGFEMRHIDKTPLSELDAAKRELDRMTEIAWQRGNALIERNTELFAAKQRIAELEADLDETKSTAWDILVKEKAEAYCTGFLAAQKKAMRLVNQWHTCQHSQFLTSNVYQAISQLKPEDSNAAQ